MRRPIPHYVRDDPNVRDDPYSELTAESLETTESCDPAVVSLHRCTSPWNSIASAARSTVEVSLSACGVTRARLAEALP